jgi:alkylated DNA repair dioxygenase AlkB
MPAAAADLFHTPILPGLTQRESFLSVAEEAALIARIDGEPLSPFRFRGWLGKRLTASFGWSYNFDRGSFDRGAPLPEWLLPIKRRAAAVVGLDDAALVQALLIRYDPSAGIGWHRDRPVFEHVIGISLGVPAILRFRRRRESSFDRAGAPLAPRSIYRLSGEARSDWEHSIAALSETRWSITFRSMTAKARDAYCR